MNLPIQLLLVPASARLLEALLEGINGRSRRRTFMTAQQVFQVADEAQAELEALDLGYGEASEAEACHDPRRCRSRLRRVCVA